MVEHHKSMQPNYPSGFPTLCNVYSKRPYTSQLSCDLIENSRRLRACSPRLLLILILQSCLRVRHLSQGLKGRGKVRTGRTDDRICIHHRIALHRSLCVCPQLVGFQGGHVAGHLDEVLLQEVKTKFGALTYVTTSLSKGQSDDNKKEFRALPAFIIRELLRVSTRSCKTITFSECLMGAKIAHKKTQILLQICSPNG